MRFKLFAFDGRGTTDQCIITLVQEDIVCAVMRNKIEGERRKLQFDRRKSKAAAVSLFLLFAIAVSLVAVPLANAQTLIMNVSTKVVVHSVVDIDLNGPSSYIANVTLWVKWPGRTAFTYVWGQPTTSSGDCDVYSNQPPYPDIFNETGNFDLKWALPPDFSVESNVVTVEVVTEILRKSYAIIGATPNPVGVNQETLLAVGVTQQLSVATDGWEGLSVTVTRPDGVVETISGIRTDSTGLTGRVYVPTMAGNYTLQTNFPKQTYRGITMEASTSRVLTLVVQEEPITFYPAHPLPTGYWTRPIDSQNREWAGLAGSWLTTPDNYYAPFNDGAPDTAHILWTKPLTSGGLVGGALGFDSDPDKYTDNPSEHSYEIGDAYEGKWGGSFGGSPSLILGGKVYYNKYATPEPYKEIVCVDLHTGEELWSRVFLNNLTLSRGQLMYWDTYDYHGVYDYLWCTGNSQTRRDFGLPSSAGNPWCAFDPFTGDYQWCFYNMPSGTLEYGPKGEFLITYVNSGDGYMTQWNSSNVPRCYASTTYASMAWGQWEPMGKMIDAQEAMDRPTLPTGLSGYNWNVTIPTGLPGSVRQIRPGNKIVGNSYSSSQVVTWGLNLNSSKGTIGSLLFNETWTPPTTWATGDLSISFGCISITDGALTLRSKEDMVRYGFSTETGKYLWTTEPLETLDHLMGGFAGESGAIAYGKFFAGTVSGVLKAFDITTGELAWSYAARDPYMQVLWSNNWPICYLFITDGKIYIATTEHSPIDPRPRGGPFICLNVTTGEEIWRANGLFRQTVWGGRAIIGDSIIATMDTYDQRIYGIGKGPSATTVSAGPEVSVHGDSVLVKGMVTDVSPGTKSAGLEMRFPNGVPAVADENMSDWMGYVYKQFERPADAVGVEVVVEVLDPNNNYYEVGRTSSDADGFFKLSFIPEVPGEYTVIASFAGSGAYYGSHAKTAVNVEEAPAASPPPTPTPAPMTDAYVLGIGSAILIAVIIGFVVLILIFRKR